MQWDDDRYREMKWKIHDILRVFLDDKDAQKITVAHSAKCIDDFVSALTSIPDIKDCVSGSVWNWFPGDQRDCLRYGSIEGLEK